MKKKLKKPKTTSEVPDSSDFDSGSEVPIRQSTDIKNKTGSSFNPDIRKSDMSAFSDEKAPTVSGNAVDLNNNSTIPEAMDEELNTMNQQNIQQELDDDGDEEPIEDEYSQPFRAA